MFGFGGLIPFTGLTGGPTGGIGVGLRPASGATEMFAGLAA